MIFAHAHLGNTKVAKRKTSAAIKDLTKMEATKGRYPTLTDNLVVDGQFGCFSLQNKFNFF